MKQFISYEKQLIHKIFEVYTVRKRIFKMVGEVKKRSYHRMARLHLLESVSADKALKIIRPKGGSLLII